MKQYTKTFTVSFFLSSLLIVVFNLFNYDDMNIIMIGLNPILNILSSSSLSSVISDIPYLWHVLCIITMIVYGFLLDYLTLIIKNR